MNRNLKRLYRIVADTDTGDTSSAPGGGATSAPANEPDETPDAPDSGTPDEDQDDEKLGEAGMKALRSERARAVKAEADLKALQKQMEDAQKTAEQKAAEELAELKAQAARANKYEAAAKAGLALTLAPRLVGNTLEELVEDAKTLAGELTKNAPAPKPDPSVGKGGKPKPQGLNAAIAAAYNT